jgi:hypothetical protein
MHFLNRFIRLAAVVVAFAASDQAPKPLDLVRAAWDAWPETASLNPVLRKIVERLWGGVFSALIIVPIAMSARLIWKHLQDLLDPFMRGRTYPREGAVLFLASLMTYLVIRGTSDVIPALTRIPIFKFLGFERAAVVILFRSALLGLHDAGIPTKMLKRPLVARRIALQGRWLESRQSQHPISGLRTADRGSAEHHDSFSSRSALSRIHPRSWRARDDTRES